MVTSNLYLGYMEYYPICEMEILPGAECGSDHRLLMKNMQNLIGIINYWMTKYDWRSSERLLNNVPHYKVLIGGLFIHYTHT